MGRLIDLGPLRRSPDLRRLFWGGGISFFGTMYTMVALPFQVYGLTRSSLDVGFLSLAELAGLLLTGMVGGLLADMVDRRRLIRATEALLTLAAGALALNAASRHPRLAVLYVASFVMSALSGLQRPSMDSLVPRLVAPEDLAATSALMALRSQFGMIAAPATAGVVIAAVGLSGTYAIDVATFGVSLLALARLGAAPPPPDEAELSWRAVRDGLRYARNRKDLLGSYGVDLTAMVFGMPNAIFPQLATGLGGASALGVLYAAPAVGSLAVTLLSGWVRRVEAQGSVIAVGATVWGLAITALAFASSLGLAATALAVAGAGDMVSGLGRMTMWNESIPDGMRGRLAGIEMLSYTTGPALGNLEAGAVTSLAGLRTAVASGGLLSAAAAVAFWAAIPAFRHYRSRAGRANRAVAS